MYSREKAGILRAERLRDALYDVGFQLSTDIMSILMLKYMRKDGTLRMGDFASAILHLTTAFGKIDLNWIRINRQISWTNNFVFFCLFVFSEVFQRKDHDQDNLIKIEMADVSRNDFVHLLSSE